MSGLHNQVLCDADSHWQEPLDILKEFADPDVRERLAPLNRESINPRGMPSCDPDFFTNGFDAEQAASDIMTAQYWAALGAADRSQRSRALDLMAVDVQLVFSSHAPAAFDKSYYGSLQRSDDPDLVYGGATALNRAMADFCAADDRLIATAYIPLDVPARSVALARDAVELGCKVLQIPAGIPSRHAWTRGELDGLWALAAEASAPVVMHKGHIDATTRPVAHGGGAPAWNGPTPLPHEQMLVTAMVLDGVFERHPALRLGIIELYAGWLPNLSDGLDVVARSGALAGARAVQYSLPLLPSEYIRRHVRVTPGSGVGRPYADDVRALIERTGPEVYMFSSDWPHDPFGAAVAAFESNLAGCDEEVRRRFYAQNFSDFVGVPLPAPARSASVAEGSAR